MLMFAQAFPPGAQLLPVTAPSGPVKVWATAAPDGTRDRPDQQGHDRRPVTVQLQLTRQQTPATLEVADRAECSPRPAASPSAARRSATTTHDRDCSPDRSRPTQTVARCCR